MHTSPLSDFIDTVSESFLMSEASSPLSRALSPLPRSRYYFDDVIAEFLVEGYLFKVHRYYLDRESPIFPRKVDQNGLIKLEGVKKIEFESLLDYFYDRKGQEMSLAAWTSILSISTRFSMSSIRSEAISAISNSRQPIDPVEQIVLAVTHDVPSWLPVAYTALCCRERSITSEEGERLGTKTALRIAEARERLRDLKLKRLGAEVDFDVADVESAVDSVFWPEEPAALTSEDEGDWVEGEVVSTIYIPQAPERRSPLPVPRGPEAHFAHLEDADHGNERYSLGPQPCSLLASNPGFKNFRSPSVNPVSIGHGLEGGMGWREREAAKSHTKYGIFTTPRGGWRSGGGQTQWRANFVQGVS